MLPEQELQQAASLFKALSDTNRLKIILELGLSDTDRGLSVSELIGKLGISQPLASHHLKELKFAGILRARRKGPFVYYSLTDPAILDMVKGVCERKGGETNDRHPPQKPGKE